MADKDMSITTLGRAFGIDLNDETNIAKIQSTPGELEFLSEGETIFNITSNAISSSLDKFNCPQDTNGKDIASFTVTREECLAGIVDADSLLKQSIEQNEAAIELDMDLAIRGSGFMSSNMMRSATDENRKNANAYLDVDEFINNGRLVIGPAGKLVAKTFTDSNQYDGAVPLNSEKDSNGKVVMAEDIATLLIPVVIANMIAFPLYWKLVDMNAYSLVCESVDGKGNAVSSDSFLRKMISISRRYLPILNNIGNTQGRLLRAHIGTLVAENTGEDPCSFGQTASIVQITRIHYAGYKKLNSYLAGLQQPSVYSVARLTPGQISDLLDSINIVLQDYRESLPLAYIASANMQNIPAEFSSIVETIIAEKEITGKVAGTSRRAVVRMYRELEYTNLLVSGASDWTNLGSKIA